MVTVEFASSLRRMVQCQSHPDVLGVQHHCGIYRYPVGGKMVVTRTDDGGKTFRVLDQGLPAVDAYHLVYRHNMELAPDRQTLALSSTTGGLWISPEAGAHWHCLSRDLPPVAALGWVQG